jgi:hypothetical protein
MKVENLAHQRPSSAFPGGGWYLDTPPFQKLVARAVFEDQPGVGHGTTREEVSRGKSHRVAMFSKEPVANFFRPPSPPWEGGKRR